MSSAFSLELDTTGPEIYIVAPQYTTPNEEIELYVIGDENLAVYQDIYIVDSRGNRHDVIFHYEGDRFFGIVKLWDYPPGMATIYAQMKDGVDNPSNLASKAISLLISADISIIARQEQRQLYSDEQTRRLDIAVFSRDIHSDQLIAEITEMQEIRKIGVVVGK